MRRLLPLLLLLSAVLGGPEPAAANACRAGCKADKRACVREAKAAWREARRDCDPGDVECVRDARLDYVDAKTECKETYKECVACCVDPNGCDSADGAFPDPE